MPTRIAFLIATGALLAGLAAVVVLNGDSAPAAGRHAMFLATFCLLALLTLSATAGRPGPRGPRPARA